MLIAQNDLDVNGKNYHCVDTFSYLGIVLLVYSKEALIRVK